jgi:acetolactate synthase regulatory subunit
MRVPISLSPVKHSFLLISEPTMNMRQASHAENGSVQMLVSSPAVLQVIFKKAN